MQRKIFLIVLVAAGLLQAMPATALADGALEDVTTGKTVDKGVKFSYSGGIEFTNGASGISCGVHMTFTTKLADEFEVSKFELTTATCSGFGALYNGCKVKSDKSTLPWTTGRYSATELIFYLFPDLELENCPMGQTFLKIEGPSVTGKPGTGTKGGITSLTLSGSGEAEDNAGEFKVGVKGSLSMGEENSDTYRIEDLP
jgi:hypothetical protein